MNDLLATHAQYAGFGAAMFPPGVSLIIIERFIQKYSAFILFIGLSNVL